MSGTGHFIWFILTLLTGFIALPFWIICAICTGSSRRKQERMIQERQLAALEEMARVNRWKGWNDK